MFKFRDQIKTMVDADILGSVIEKFTSKDINLSPHPQSCIFIWMESAKQIFIAFDKKDAFSKYRVAVGGISV